MGKTSRKRAKVDPFSKVKKSTGDLAAVVKAEGPTAAAIDRLAELIAEYKHLASKMEAVRGEVVAFGKEEVARGIMMGKKPSFKMMGVEAVLTFFLRNGRGIPEENLALIRKEFGAKTVEDLTETDLHSIRVNGEALEKHYAAVVAAIQTLPPDVVEGLFLPPNQVAVKEAIQMSRGYAKNPASLIRLLELLCVIPVVQ